MEIIPIYIKSLEINNIRTFGEDIFLNLEKEDGTIPNWTLILGDNGIGKSTLLQCIAWMKPYLPYDTKTTEGFEPAPIINDEENETLARLVRRNKDSSDIKAVFVAKKQIEEKKNAKVETLCTTKMNIKLANGKLKDVDHSFETNKKNETLFYTQEILLFAYSASRQLGKLNLSDPNLLDTIPSFISEKTELYDAEEILHTLNYAELGSKNKKEKVKYKNFIKEVKKMLVEILPDFRIIEDIEISPPKILNQDTEGGIIISTRHGQKIPFDDFSLGYKTVSSWTIDLAWRLFNKYQGLSGTPLKEPAIVLIDEIDLHLHPVWQRKIMKNLSYHFPKVQFIATAHSPLMVQAAIHANYAVLNYKEEGVDVENNPEGIDGWRVDQILTSEFFGLKTSRGEEYEKLFDKREELINKKNKLSPKEKDELDRVTKELYELPTGENPKEIENRKLITDIVSKIRNEKVKIKQ